MLVLLVAIVVYPPEYVYRVLVWQESDYSDYKYMWYGFFRGQDGYDFAAEGDHGQFIYVSPAKNLIIVPNGLEYGQDWSWVNWIKTAYDFASEFNVTGGS